MNQDFDSKCREFGNARLAIAAEAQSQSDWERLWKAPAHSFPFAWGTCWKQCVEYRVDDYAREIGFFLDVLGFDAVALAPDFAMLNNEAQEFFLAVRAAENGSATPPDAIRIQFLIDGILETAAELEGRGIRFEKRPEPCEPSSPMLTGWFRTPHGVPVDLWGMVQDPQ